MLSVLKEFGSINFKAVVALNELIVHKRAAMRWAVATSRLLSGCKLLNTGAVVYNKHCFTLIERLWKETGLGLLFHPQ